jgi:excisionase family DNA binding protein
MSEDPWLDTQQAAKYLAVSDDTVLRAIKLGPDRGGLRAFRPNGGRVIRIRQSWLDAYVDAHSRADQVAVRRRRRTARTA